VCLYRCLQKLDCNKVSVLSSSLSELFYLLSLLRLSPRDLSLKSLNYKRGLYELILFTALVLSRSQLRNHTAMANSINERPYLTTIWTYYRQPFKATLSTTCTKVWHGSYSLTTRKYVLNHISNFKNGRVGTSPFLHCMSACWHIC
jgi:hypothetical protein